MTIIFMRGLISAVQMIIVLLKKYELVMIPRRMLGCWVWTSRQTFCPTSATFFTCSFWNLLTWCSWHQYV